MQLWIWVTVGALAAAACGERTVPGTNGTDGDRATPSRKSADPDAPRSATQLVPGKAVVDGGRATLTLAEANDPTQNALANRVTTYALSDMAGCLNDEVARDPRTLDSVWRFIIAVDANGKPMHVDLSPVSQGSDTPSLRKCLLSTIDALAYPPGLLTVDATVYLDLPAKPVP